MPALVLQEDSVKCATEFFTETHKQEREGFLAYRRTTEREKKRKGIEKTMENKRGCCSKGVCARVDGV